MASVLIVDDDADSAEILSRYLVRIGHEPLTATNGWEALLTLDSHEVDLVLLDLSMPGMDGATFLNIIRNDRRRAKLPVILVTALKDNEQFLRATQLGVSNTLFKSRFTAPDFYPSVNRALEGAHN